MIKRSREQKPPALPHRHSGFAGRLLRSHLALLHLLDQTLWPHIGPECLDVIKAFLARRLSEYRLPAVGYISENRPQRMLTFVIDENQVVSIRVFKGVSHNAALSRGNWNESLVDGLLPMMDNTCKQKVVRQALP